MATEEDVMEMLDSNEEPFKSSTDNAKDKKPKKESLWDKTDFTPLKLDVSKFLEDTPKSFWVYLYTTDSVIPDTIKVKLEKIATVLAKKNWQYRCNASSKENVLNSLISIENLQTNIYLPWKSYNDKVPIKPTLAYPNASAYRVATAYNKKFLELPPAVRAIYANIVNSVYNVDCNDPVKLVLVYTSCGTEKLKPKMDFKTLGNLPFIIKLCDEADIPLINIKNDDAISRIASVIA